MISRIIAVLAITLLLAPLALGATISFVNIADTTSGFNSFMFGEAPDINNNGLVVFHGRQASSGQYNYYVGSASGTPTLVSAGVGGPPSINDSGDIAYSNSSTGVYKVSGGVTTPIAVANGTLSSFGAPRINAAGTVLFYAHAAGIGRGWYTGSGGALTTIADTSGPLLGDDSNIPSINSSGTVAFHSSFDAGGDGIFTGNGGPLITSIASAPSGPYSGLGSDPDINDSGMLSFYATLKTGGDAIVRRAGGSDTTIATEPGEYGLLGGPTAINSNGTVAFKAALGGGGPGSPFGLFIGPDSVADKVIVTGDPLFGSTVINVSSPALNDRGDVAFWYHLANDATGIAVAHTPEPTSMSLLLLPFGVVVLRQLARRRR